MIDFSTAVLVLSVAFFSSLGHCLGMCGGFMVAISGFSQGSRAIIGYNLARFLSYVFLGGIFGAFGGIFVVSIKFRGYLFFLLGILLVLLGIALLRRGWILDFFENNKLLSQIIIKKFGEILRKKQKFGFLLLGFLNGLLPCGVVYYFLAIAIQSGSAIGGISVMVLFGIVSLVMMSFYGIVVKKLSERFKKLMLVTSSIIIIAQGIYLSFIGFMATNG